MPDAKVMQACNATNVLLNYNQHFDLIDNKITIDLGLQSIKKYWG